MPETVSQLLVCIAYRTSSLEADAPSQIHEPHVSASTGTERLP